MPVFFVVFIFKIGSHSEAQAGPELMIFLPQTPAHFLLVYLELEDEAII